MDEIFELLVHVWNLFLVFLGLNTIAGFVAMWGGLFIVFLPLCYIGNSQEDKQWLESQKSNVRRAIERGVAAGVETRDEETRWLSSMSMAQRLVAVRLLIAHIDELHESDQPFLEQVKRLPRFAPDHVRWRMAACNYMLRYFDAVKSYEERWLSRSTECFFFALLQATASAIFFSIVIKFFYWFFTSEPTAGE